MFRGWCFHPAASLRYTWSRERKLGTQCRVSWIPNSLLRLSSSFHFLDVCYIFPEVLFVLIGESPLDCKEIQPVHSEGDQPWDFFERNDAKAESPVLWPPHVKSWLIGKDYDAGRNWGQEEKGTTEDEMAGWHHWLDGHESEWTPGVGDGQGGLACCDSWGRKESDMTEWMNWTELIGRNKDLLPEVEVSHRILTWWISKKKCV